MRNFSEPTQEALEERAAQLFEDAVAGENLLMMYARQIISSATLMERLEYLRSVADRDAPYSLEDEADFNNANFDDDQMDFGI